MPYLQFKDQRIPLAAGELTVGAFDGAGVRLPGDDASASAVIVLAGEKQVVVRRGRPDAAVTVNGVAAGVEPVPLLHGDRLEVGGHELRYGDDDKGGSTQFISAADLGALAKARGTAPAKPTTATGGRLVSLVDGREYAIPDVGLTIGREVGNDIVIASGEVSRKHIGIAPGEGGYLLTDYSTNGAFVNGQRVEQNQLLGRADVIKVGPEEFRFYADTAKAAAPAPSAPAPVPPAAPEPIAVESAIASAAPAEPVAPAAPAAPVPPRRAPIATLEMLSEGPAKGTRFELYAALTNVGRGEHNDIVLNDESVSDSHAKLQKRGDGWWIVDQDSTNGTYVGGRRVQGEQRIEGAPDLRFGGIKMTFRAVGDAPDAGKGTRAIAALNVDAAKRAATTAKAPAKTEAAPVAEKKKGCAVLIAAILTLGAAGASMLVLLLSTRA